MKVRVLAFHHISSLKDEGKKYPGITTPLGRFKILLLILKICRYKFCLFQEIPIHQAKRIIVLNFDDAYYSVYKNAFPFFSLLGIKAHLCITGESISNPSRVQKLPLINLQEARILKHNGWDFINHSMNHTVLLNKDTVELEEEIIEPANKFKEEGLFLNPDFFCLPEGKSDESANEFIRLAGYKYVLTSREDLWDTDSNSMMVPRINIGSQSLHYALYKIIFKFNSREK